MAGYKSASFDPDAVATASDAASSALAAMSGVSDAASAATVKAAAASSKIAAQSAAWESGGGSGVSKDIHQDTHGFVVGDVLYLNGTTYTKAIADAVATAEVVGIVSAVAAGTDDFTLSGGGYVSGLSSLTAGTVYFLSPSSAGTMTATEPTTTGHISKPLFIADTTTSGYFFNFRGMEIMAAASESLNFLLCQVFS